jgi:hypothetical protein
VTEEDGDHHDHGDDGGQQGRRVTHPHLTAH